MTYDVQHNRLRVMRMKDGRRWVNIYRGEAWDRALEEARHRSFLGTMLYAVGALFGRGLDSQ